MTTSSNIVIGVAAWASSSFVLGQRCSNAANLYQCTTPGSSTVAPTGTGASINNGGAAVFQFRAAIDYATINAWVAALVTGSVAAGGVTSTVGNTSGVLSTDVVGLLWMTASAASGLNAAITTTATYATISGLTCTASLNATLKPAPGESFRDNITAASGPLAFTASQGWSISAGGGYNDTFAGTADYLILSGLQVKTTNNKTTGTKLTGKAVIVDSCLFDGLTSRYTAIVFLNCPTGFPSTLRNSLLIDRTAATPTAPFYTVASGWQLKVVNNTLVLMTAYTGSVAISIYDGTSTNGSICRNNIVLGYDNVFGNGGGNYNVDHNLVSDATYTNNTTGTIIDGGGSLFSKTAANQFVSATTDFRLKAGADALDAAQTDTTNLPAATDILGTVRP